MLPSRWRSWQQRGNSQKNEGEYQEEEDEEEEEEEEGEGATLLSIMDTLNMVTTYETVDGWIVVIGKIPCLEFEPLTPTEEGISLIIVISAIPAAVMKKIYPEAVEGEYLKKTINIFLESPRALDVDLAPTLETVDDSWLIIKIKWAKETVPVPLWNKILTTF